MSVAAAFGGVWQTLAPMLALMLLSAFLPEVGTGNTPVADFFSVKSFVFLTVIGYGVPVVLIRELAVRKQLGTAGIVIAGFAYGSYNEGLWAKTLVNVHAPPVTNFADYGDVGGIAIPWALVISIWHALGSVLFPILFVDALFPGARNRPWLDARFAVALAAATLALASFAFLAPYKQPGTVGQLVIFLTVIGGGMLLATRFRRAEGAAAPAVIALPELLVFSIILPFIGLAMLGTVKAPLIAFIAAWIAVVAAYTAIMMRCRWQLPPNLVLFGLGFYIETVTVAMIIRRATAHGAIAELITGIVMLAIFVWAAVALTRRNGPSIAGNSSDAATRHREATM